jgi:hypothetical protein
VEADWRRKLQIFRSLLPIRCGGKRRLGLFLPGWERHYYIYVGRGRGEPAYGHYLEFSFHPSGADDLETHVKKSNIEWSESGVTFKEASGHILFIPKEMFIGGR